MPKTYFLIVEDKSSIKTFERQLPNDRSTFCKSYAEAEEAINKRELSPDDFLFVVLDHDLGCDDEHSGVQIYFQVKKKFPHAAIINYSSNPENFLAVVRKAGQDNDLIFDATFPNKSARVCVSFAFAYAEAENKKGFLLGKNFFEDQVSDKKSSGNGVGLGASISSNETMLYGDSEKYALNEIEERGDAAVNEEVAASYLPEAQFSFQTERVNGIGLCSCIFLSCLKFFPSVRRSRASLGSVVPLAAVPK